MLQGMIIGYMESDISDIFSYAEKFVPKIDNWSVCDSFCSGFKHALKHQDEVWKWLEQFVKSEREFEVRFGVVMLLNYYIDDAYVNRLFPIFEAIRQDGYYVKMAVAWAISICYIKYPQKTMVFLRESKLDVFTYNKSLQKIVESRCVSEEEKIQIRKMRKFNA
jgi:3-methyladenine DNA glycosylase AlkD